MPAWICPSCHGGLDGDATRVACPDCGLTLHRNGRRWLDGSPGPAGFDGAAVRRLQAMETHFWMRERRRLVARILAGLPCGRDHVTELGCGTGGLLPVLEQRFGQVCAVDGHAILLAQAEANSTTARLVQADVCRSPLPSGRSDLVVAFDVIEHVDPDDFLREARRLVRPGGMLLVSAPASPALWSAMDEAAGHRCRYTRRQLAGEMRRHGWAPLGFTHYQMLLFAAVWASRLVRRGRGSVERRPPRWLDRLLGSLNRLETHVSRGRGLPFGSSIFMWARAVQP